MDNLLITVFSILMMAIAAFIYQEDISVFRESPEYALCVERGGIPKPNWSNTFLDECVMGDK